MSRRPEYASVDLIVPVPFRDPTPAGASTLPISQHAIMSGWGGPPQSRTFAMTCDGSPITTTISYRVPPGVTTADMEVLISGNGRVTLTTTEDATGVTLVSAIAWDDTSTAEGAAYLRAAGLVLLSAAVWEWTAIDIDVELSLDAGDEVITYELIVYPQHVPR